MTRTRHSWTWRRRASLAAAASSTAIAQCGKFWRRLPRLASPIEVLTINNRGTCPLAIGNIIGSPDFLAPSVLSYPLLVGAGDSIDVVVRFQPSAPFGAKAGTITIVSDDPAGPHMVPVSGVAAGAQGEPDHRQHRKLRRRLRRLVRRRAADRDQQRQVHAFRYRHLVQLAASSWRRKSCPTRSRSGQATLCRFRSGLSPQASAPRPGRSQSRAMILRAPSASRSRAMRLPASSRSPARRRSAA